MAILKKVNGKYKNEEAIYNLVNYIFNADKMPHGILGGQGVYMFDAAGCMEFVRRMLGAEGCRAEHYVLSFADHEAVKLKHRKTIELGYRICEYFEDRQAIFACHETKDKCDFMTGDRQGNIHFHFVVAAWNLHTGKKCTLNYDDFMTFRLYTEALLEEFEISTDYLTAVY